MHMVSVRDGNGRRMERVSDSPGPGEYRWDGETLTINGADAGSTATYSYRPRHVIRKKHQRPAWKAPWPR